MQEIPGLPLPFTVPLFLSGQNPTKVQPGRTVPTYITSFPRLFVIKLSTSGSLPLAISELMANWSFHEEINTYISSSSVLNWK